MPVRRTYGSYDDGCAAAHALDLVGDRWSLIVVRELVLGPKRFNDLRADIPGISATLLTQRLRELDDEGIVTQVELPAPARGSAYALTPWGAGLEDILQVLGRWAAQSPALPHDAQINDSTAVLAMRTMSTIALPRLAGRRIAGEVTLLGRDGRPTSYRIDLDQAEDPEHGRIVRGAHPEPAFTVTAAPKAWIDVLLRGKDLAAAEQAGTVAVTGDRGTLQAMIDAYPDLTQPDPYGQNSTVANSPTCTKPARR